MPVGPVNLTIINEGARRGFKWAALIGLGAATMDVIYCTIAFTGFSSFFGSRHGQSLDGGVHLRLHAVSGRQISFGQNRDRAHATRRAASRIEKRIDEKLHPHSAFMIGFARVLGNMGVLLFWIVVAAYFMSHESWFTSYEWVEDTIAAKAAFIAGVALGANLWFCALSYRVSRGQAGSANKPCCAWSAFPAFACSDWDYTMARTSLCSWRGIDMEFEMPPREHFSAIKSC